VRKFYLGGGGGGMREEGALRKSIVVLEIA